MQVQSSVDWSCCAASAILWTSRGNLAMAKNVRIGDVIEIPTGRGLAYAQYCLRKERWGALLRILPGFHQTRPSDLSQVVAQKERFVIFFPLQAAVNRKIFEVVANHE